MQRDTTVTPPRLACTPAPGGRQCPQPPAACRPAKATGMDACCFVARRHSAALAPNPRRQWAQGCQAPNLSSEVKQTRGVTTYLNGGPGGGHAQQHAITVHANLQASTASTLAEQWAAATRGQHGLCKVGVLANYHASHVVLRTRHQKSHQHGADHALGQSQPQKTNPPPCTSPPGCGRAPPAYLRGTHADARESKLSRGTGRTGGHTCAAHDCGRKHAVGLVQVVCTQPRRTHRARPARRPGEQTSEHTAPATHRCRTQCAGPPRC